MNKRLLTIFLGLVLLSGCSLVEPIFKSKPKNTAQELLRAGNKAMQEKDYSNAIDYYKKLKKKFPFSPYTVKAQLRLADAYFKREDLVQAETIYKDFNSLHPGNENIPYVLYQIGLCNYKRFESIDLPLTETQEALRYFQRVYQSFPNSQYAGLAKDYIGKCKKYIARHEIYVANFYWNTEQYQAAWKRYRYVLNNFEELPEISAFARKRSKLAYLKYQKSRAASIRREIQGSWKDWFEWL